MFIRVKLDFKTCRKRRVTEENSIPREKKMTFSHPSASHM